MVIQVKTKNKLYFILGKERGKQPHITPYRSKAHNFTDLGTCKNIRDDVLEYLPTATIVG